MINKTPANWEGGDARRRFRVDHDLISLNPRLLRWTSTLLCCTEIHFINRLYTTVKDILYPARLLPGTLLCSECRDMTPNPLNIHKHWCDPERSVRALFCSQCFGQSLSQSLRPMVGDYQENYICSIPNAFTCLGFPSLMGERRKCNYLCLRQSTVVFVVNERMRSQWPK